MGINQFETHTLIIWSNAISQKEVIFQKLRSSFTIKRIFKMQWDKNCFINNLRVFYSHSQKHLSSEKYDELLEKKIEHCGDNEFFLVVYEDESPEYENRQTSSGNRKVNINVFDLKQELRRITGGGHKIHTSDNVFESNKDITLLLGKNIKDFNAEYPDYSVEESIYSDNCTGVDGFQNISQLFYVLNNTIDYVVMRNFECLPAEYTLEGHGDIDLLVEDLNYIKYLTNAKPVYPDLSYRVHHIINIDNYDIPFDFRYIGDDYYDIKWQLEILKTKKVFKDIIYVPDNTNHFYSLLYHAYVQKPAVKDDYHIKLEKLAASINVSYNKQLPQDKAKELLDVFFKEKQYSYTVAEDKTVFYNSLFTQINKINVVDYGRKIAQSQCRYENQVFFSEVYEKEDIITKIASKEIILNEVKYLKKLAESNYVPKYISHNIFDDYGIIQMEKIEGISIALAYKTSGFWTKKNIKICIGDGYKIVKLLAVHNISHRDIRPENLIFRDKKGKRQLYIIDFGWAVDIGDKNSIIPFGLGSKYRYGDGNFSDAYSMGKTILFIVKSFSFTKQTTKKLMGVLPESYKNKDMVINELSNSINEIKYTFEDHLKLFLNRYPRLKKLMVKIKRVFI